MKMDEIKNFIIKNSKYFGAGVLGVVLIIVLVFTTKDGKENTGGTDEEVVSVEDSTEATNISTAQNAFEIDKYSDVNNLIERYYKAYADGDIETLKQIATPFTDEEAEQKSSLKDYIKSFENLSCYTKVGPIEGSYMVAVYLEIKFKGIKTTAPGLQTLYLCTNEDGELYIDNRAKQDLEPEVQAYAVAFEQAEDYTELSKKVKEKYEEALAGDEELKVFMDKMTKDSSEKDDADTQEDEKEEETKENKKEKDTKEQSETTDESTKEQTTSETVWATEPAKIRKGPSENDQQVGSAYKGDHFKRTAVRDDGWSEIEYNGDKAYIKTEFLSTSNPVSEESNNNRVYHTEGQVVTVNTSTNIRASMSEDAKLMGTAAPGDTVTVIMDYAEGWTKVKWNEKTGYIRTDLLR